MLTIFIEELTGSLPDARETIRVIIRLTAAMLAGAIIGWQRERSGKAAGLRTHMLVSLGSAVFMIGGTEIGMAQDAISRVIQGLATGIGFLGAGAILKMEGSREIYGLTTAAGIWMTAAIGVAIGLGNLGMAAIAVLFAWTVLALVLKLERHVGGSDDNA